MNQLVKENLPVSRSIMERADAIKLFEEMGEKYKVEIIDSIPGEEPLSFYKQGDFIDLCRGPHVPSTGHIKAFKLMSVAGAYWRGDSKNEMLQRIYGTAWGDKKALKAHLHRLEEAEKRDHRKLGKQLNLFHMQEEAPGMVFWHPHGWTLYQQIEQYMRTKQRQHGYQEIKTPAGGGTYPVGKIRSLGQVPGADVHHSLREPRFRHQADELPVPRAGVQPGAALLP